MRFFLIDSRVKYVRKRRWFPPTAGATMLQSLNEVPLFPSPAQYLHVIKGRSPYERI